MASMIEMEPSPYMGHKQGSLMIMEQKRIPFKRDTAQNYSKFGIFTYQWKLDHCNGIKLLDLE